MKKKEKSRFQLGVKASFMEIKTVTLRRNLVKIRYFRGSFVTIQLKQFGTLVKVSNYVRKV